MSIGDGVIAETGGHADAGKEHVVHESAARDETHAAARRGRGVDECHGLVEAGPRRCREEKTTAVDRHAIQLRRNVSEAEEERAEARESGP